jgi:hypothetical protein
MKNYRFRNLNVEVFDDNTISTCSDSLHTYLAFHYTDGCQDSQGSTHGVRIYDNGNEVNSCLIIGSGGTTIHDSSSILDDDLLLICCGDALFCLVLPSLDLKWQTHVDLAACFQVLKLEDDYLVHGEIEVSRINREGEIKWSFSGADIFVTLDETKPLILYHDHILLTDFEGNTYKIDFKGNVVCN